MLVALATALVCALSSLAASKPTFVVRDTGRGGTLVFDPYINRWVLTTDATKYIRSSINRHTVEGFGSKISHSEFQRNTPVTDAALTGAKKTTTAAAKVPIYGALAKPFQRLAYRMDKAHKTKSR